MNLTLIHEGGIKFSTQGDSGRVVEVDASPAVGGSGSGFRPMELFLVALASCTSIDTVLILNKSRKPYRNYQVKIEGRRREEIPQTFSEIILTFSLDSEDIPVDVFHRAVSLSLTKYCSVAEMIRSEVSIRAQVELNGKLDSRVIEKLEK